MIARDPSDFGEGLAAEELAAPASVAIAAVPAIPTDADALSRRPTSHTGAGRVDDADHLVTRHARVCDQGKATFYRQAVAMTHTASLDFYPNHSGTGRGDIAFHDLERRFGTGNLNSTHFGHRCSLDAGPAVGGSQIQIQVVLELTLVRWTVFDGAGGGGRINTPH
jgi:hypothetical protein